MSGERLSPPPKPEKSDLLHRIEKAVVALTPATQAAAQLLGLLESPLERRRAEWFESLWEAGRKLQEQMEGMTDETLSGNDAFVSAVLHANQIAARTHQAEKLEALRNAVLNVAAGSALEEDRQMMFLDAVDGLTPSHVTVLRRFSSKPDVFHTAESARLKTRIGDEQIVQILRDLRNRGFVEVDTTMDQLHVSTLRNTSAKITGYGQGFVGFITSPLEGDDVSA